MKVVGWTDAYTSPHKEEPFTEDHKMALTECIRRRHYNFNFNDMCFLPYNAPYFDTGKLSLPSKDQFDAIMNNVYAEIARGNRLRPSDAIKNKPVNYVIYEKKEYEPKGEDV